jgi:hypothetical protein
VISEVSAVPHLVSDFTARGKKLNKRNYENHVVSKYRHGSFHLALRILLISLPYRICGCHDIAMKRDR